MTHNSTYEYQAEDGHAIKATFSMMGGGTIAHLDIKLSHVDEQTRPHHQQLSVDCVLDQQFHLLVTGLKPGQADQFARHLLDNSDLKTVERKIVYSKNDAGKITDRRIFDVSGVAFNMAFAAITHAIPSLGKLFEQVSGINNPVWQAACTQANPFFGSANHSAKFCSGKSGIEFNFENCRVWVANDGQNPQHAVTFFSQKKGMDFAIQFPANRGGGIMTLTPEGSMQFHFSAADDRLDGTTTKLEQTIDTLHRIGLISRAEAEMFATHQTLMGNGGARTLPMETLLQRLQHSR